MKLLRNDTPIDPEVQRQLDAIDAALAGEPVEARDSALAELALAVTDQRPAPSESFRQLLDRRFEAGFAPEVTPTGADGRPPRIDWSRLRSAWRPLVAGAAASMLLVAGVAGSGVLSGDDSQPTQVAQQPTVAGEGLESAQPEAAAKAPSGAIAPDTIVTEPPISPPPRDAADNVRARQVETNATLVLATAPDDVENASDEVVRVVDEHKGFVLESSVTGGEGTPGNASFQLRVPADELQGTIADLSKVAHVQQRTQNLDDITSSFVSLRSRTSAATKERQGLLRQLAAANTPNETASVKAQLRSVDRRLAALRAQARRLDNRVAFSNVDLTVKGDSTAGGGGSFTPGDALDDAGKILSSAVAVALIALAIAIPVALLLGLLWFATSGLRRRARERALDSADPREGEAQAASSVDQDQHSDR